MGSQALMVLLQAILEMQALRTQRAPGHGVTLRVIQVTAGPQGIAILDTTLAIAESRPVTPHQALWDSLMKGAPLFGEDSPGSPFDERELGMGDAFDLHDCAACNLAHDCPLAKITLGGWGPGRSAG